MSKLAQSSSSWIGTGVAAACLFSLSACGKEGRTPSELLQVMVPGAVDGGNVEVACNVSCDDGEDGGACSGGDARVYVSACDQAAAGVCFEIEPVTSPDSEGNTYIVAVDDSGRGDVLESTRCVSSDESSEGLPIDLLFVIDTTSSMANAISGVLSSVDSFVNTLAAKHVVARIGGIAFGDRAPLASCTMPDAPLAPFTDDFGPGTQTNPESFNYWLANLSATHCGDGGGDAPENALDAIEFALGNDPLTTDAFPASAFQWDPQALHVMVVITDVSQHMLNDGSFISTTPYSKVKSDLTGFGIAHVVGPNLACWGTSAANCACNTTPLVCDPGCACDLACTDPSCADDVRAQVCDATGSTCDLDCPGYHGSSCDIRAGVCDPVSSSKQAVPCDTDIDCINGATVGSISVRRCEPTSSTPYADMSELAAVTHGTFTPLPMNGYVDLTTLPLSGVITSTEICETDLPKDVAAVRCVYRDGDGNEGEVVVPLNR